MSSSPGRSTTPGRARARISSSRAFARQVARIEAGLVKPEVHVGNLDARRDMTDVRDIAEAYVMLMDAAPAGRPFNICSGRAWKVGDLLAELLHAARVPSR
jgi:GDP-4-dehydro-6-deoxy-D-mannose reductase